jgi:hypothetical protein
MVSSNSLKIWTHTRHLDQIKFRQGYWSYVLLGRWCQFNLLLISVSPQFLGWLILAVIPKIFESESRVDSLSECYDGQYASLSITLKDLNPHKASGPDQIPTRLLKLCASDLAPAIARVFQTSLNSGTDPSLFKSGDIPAGSCLF